MEIVFLSMLLFFTALMFLISSRFTRRNVLFSVFVPDAFVEHDIIKTTKAKYQRSIILLAVICTLIFIVISLFTSKNIMLLAFIIILHLIIIGGIIAFKNAHDLLKTKKHQLNWMKDIKVVKATDTSLITEEKKLPDYLFLIQLIAYIIAMIFVAINYDKIPNTIATHWGLNGKADGYSDKNIWTVFEIGIIGIVMLGILWGSSKGVSFFNSTINPANKKASVEHSKQTKFLNQLVVLVTSFIMTSFFIITLIRPVIYGKDYLPNTIINALFVIMILVVIIGIIMQVNEDRKFRMAVHETDKAPYYNDDNYVWGLFYYNKEDSNVWVPKQSDFGMTLNMARPVSWFIMFMLVVFPLIPVIIMLLFTN